MNYLGAQVGDGNGDRDGDEDGDGDIDRVSPIDILCRIKRQLEHGRDRQTDRQSETANCGVSQKLLC